VGNATLVVANVLTCNKHSQKICSCPELLQHPSSLTALQSLTVHRPKDGWRSFLADLENDGDGPLLFNQQLVREVDLKASDLSGIQSLSRLTCLQLQIPGLYFSTKTVDS
jgi:hypothetical protein